MNGKAALEVLKQPARRLVAPAGIIFFVAGLQLVAGFIPNFIEQQYSLGLYPRILVFLSLTSKHAGFSVAEFLLLFPLAGIGAWIVWATRGIIQHRRRMRHVLASSFTLLLWVSSVVALIFMLVYGLNYQRPPLVESLRLEQRAPDALETEAMSRAIIDGLNQNYTMSGAVASGEEGSRLPLSRTQLFAVLEESFAREPLLSGISAGVAHVPPKPVYFSGLMSHLGISGIYSPFTGEANYNAIQPDSSLPFTIAHEMAHQRGFARESEASFVAFLVCIKSSHPYVRYSGYLHALRVLAVLRRLAPERYAEVAALIGDGPRSDLRASDAFWNRYSGGLSRLSRRVNNLYLRANRVKSGVRNYGEVVSLIIGYYLSHGPAPTPVADSAVRSYP